MGFWHDPGCKQSDATGWIEVAEFRHVVMKRPHADVFAHEVGHARRKDGKHAESGLMAEEVNDTQLAEEDRIFLAPKTKLAEK